MSDSIFHRMSVCAENNIDWPLKFSFRIDLQKSVILIFWCNFDCESDGQGCRPAPVFIKQNRQTKRKPVDLPGWRQNSSIRLYFGLIRLFLFRFSIARGLKSIYQCCGKQVKNWSISIIYVFNLYWIHLSPLKWKLKCPLVIRWEP